MHHRPRSARRPSSIPIVAGLLAVTALPWSAAGAQWIGGFGDDALVLPRGMLRMTVQGVNTTYGERYTSAGAEATSARVPLGDALSASALGAAQVPALATLQSQLRALTGLADLDVTLGRFTVRADARRSEIPVRFEVGIGGRLQLSVMVPYVQTRVAVRVTGDATAAEANLGLNPGIGSEPTLAANQAFVAQLRAAAGELRTRLEGCDADPTAPVCGDRAAAEQLNAFAESFADDVVTVYGTPDGGGSVFVPVLGTAAADAVGARIAGFRAAYQGYGVDAIAEGAGPRGAAGGAPAEVIRAELAGGSLGPGLQPLGDVNRYGLGDAEIGARFRLLDPFGGDPRARVESGGLMVRASVGALVRVGTGTPDEPLNLLDVGTGDGQHDVEVQLAADVLSGRRLSTSVVARYGVQLPDELDRAVPGAGAEGYLLEGNVVRVERDLGDYAEVELTPRFAVTELIAVGATYRFRSKGADSYALPAGALPDDVGGAASVEVLGLGSETRQHLAGVGVVLSTLPAYARGRVSVPLEVSYRHTRTVAGAGRLTPHGSRDELALRVYLDLFGGR